MSYWKEIENNYGENPSCELQEGIEKIIYIDAWRTSDDEEEGKVIAQVIKCDCGKVFVAYIDNVARADGYAQEVIREAIKQLKEGK